MRNIFESTRDYEAWMQKRTDVSRKLLERKHRKMAAGAFPFLRATFYRWVERWPKVCPRLAERDEDVLLAVGDLHVENFGVWRDSRSRLVWGINDFDDACELSFTSDLVRLAASAILAAAAADLDVSAKRVCALLLAGYRAGLRTEGKSILLSDGRHAALVKLTRHTEEDPKTFWKKKLDPHDNPAIDAADLPEGLEDMFRASFPPGANPAFRVQKSPGGLGSLGRRRFTAVEKPRNGVRDAREAKALVPSALYWRTKQDHMPSQTATLLQHAIRDPDPHFQVHDAWLVRQLAPDIAKIEMPANKRDKRLALAPALLRLMGRETANIHLGSRSRDALEKLLNRLQQDELWFPTATERMADCTRKDHAEWTKHYQD
jgi:Ser/Thr protein kinase RdoA (MazF antagonist)